MRRAKKCLSPMPIGVRWCNDVPLPGGVAHAKDRKIKSRIKIALIDQ